MNSSHVTGATGGVTIWGSLVLVLMSHYGLTAETAGGYATLILAALGAAYMFLQWYFTWQFPNAPSLPDLAAAAADASARSVAATARHQAAILQAQQAARPAEQLPPATVVQVHPPVSPQVATILGH
jgi:hypothetical protein